MIKEIFINNFKCFKKLEIKGVNLVNLISGVNNIGKTTLLEALFMFYDRISSDLVIKQFIWRGVNKFSLNPIEVWAPIFTNYDTNNEIQIIINNEIMSLKLNKKYSSSILKNKDTNLINIPSTEVIKDNIISALDLEIKEGKVIRQKSHLIINNNGLAHNIDYAKSTGISTNIILNKSINNLEIASRFSKLDEQGKTEKIISILKIIEPRLKDLSLNVIGNNTYVYGKLDGLRKMPIAYMGDGMNRLLAFITSILDNKNSIVFIDEFDNGFHHSILNKIWEILIKLAKDNNCQLFITTHSYECIKSFIIGGINNEKYLNYIRLDKDKHKDVTIAKNYNYDVLSSSIENNWEVR